MLRIVADAGALATAAADEFVQLTTRAVAARGRCTVALAGGSTPLGLYRELAGRHRASVPWSRLHVFWGDERHVPPDHPDSNFLAIKDAMLDHVPISDEHVHRVRSELPDAHAVAADYEHVLRRVFVLDSSQWPAFDVVLLGMGIDGHTASLFPGSDALRDERRLVLAPWVQKFDAHRITLSPGVPNRADHAMFLVSGAAKAEMLDAVLNGAFGPEVRPAQVVRPMSRSVLWMVDRAAASRLQPSTGPGPDVLLRLERKTSR